MLIRLIGKALGVLFYAGIGLAGDQLPVPDPSLGPDLNRIKAMVSAPEITGQLIDRSQNRPVKCPLRSDLHLWDIHKKLYAIHGALRYGECYNKNKDMVDGFDSLLKERDSYMSSLQNGQTVQQGAGSSSGVQNQASVQSRQIFSVLSAVSQDEDCMLNIKKRGLLPVIADVATNIGLVASIMPTPNGFVIGASGIAIGSALRIINGLFKSPFDWNNANERKQFLDMNCSFFDLRRDIESAEVVELQDTSLDEKIARAKTSQQKLLKELDQNSQKRLSWLKQLAAMEKTWLEKSLGQEPLLLLSRIEKVIPGLLRMMKAAEEGHKQENMSKIEAIHLFMTEFPEIDRLLSKETSVPPYMDYVRGLIKEFTWDKLSDFNGMDLGKFEQVYAHPLNFYLQKYTGELRSRRDTGKKNWLHEKNSHVPRKSNEEVSQDLLKSFEDADALLKNTVGRLEARIAVLQAKDRKLTFDILDEGAHTTYDILEEYQYIQDIIYGKLGYSFVNYFRKQISSEHKQFQKNYRKFRKKYRIGKKPVKDLEKVWACRDASALRINWEKANAAAEVFYDFIGTNTGIFHTNTKKISTFLFVIPTGRARQLLLYRYIRGAEYAVDVIGGKRPYASEEVKRFSSRHSHNLAELILDVHHSRGRREAIEDFWDREMCQGIL